jgi:hypothetical protein
VEISKQNGRSVYKPVWVSPHAEKNLGGLKQWQRTEENGFDPVLHELEAELNGLNSLLVNSLVETVAHLEHLVSATILIMDKPEHGALIKQLTQIETLDDDIMDTVHVIGESTQDVKDKSKREVWWQRRNEVIDLIKTHQNNE